jgi:hypothetical protein
VNWIPSYVRNEFKKKTGMVINEKGEIVSKQDDSKEDDINGGLFNDKQNVNQKDQKEQKQYTPIGQYKPTGNLVYNPEMFEKIEKKVSFA